MSNLAIPKALRQQLFQRAHNSCEYCQTPMWLTGIIHEIDHIIPRAKQGASTIDNLCLACSSCNGFKQAKTQGFDPDTQQSVALFHPRQQLWAEHFQWSEAGTHLIGLTPTGRVTIEILQINNDLMVTARTIWVSMGYHPPK